MGDEIVIVIVLNYFIVFDVDLFIEGIRDFEDNIFFDLIMCIVWWNNKICINCCLEMNDMDFFCFIYVNFCNICSLWRVVIGEG